MSEATLKKLLNDIVDAAMQEEGYAAGRETLTVEGAIVAAIAHIQADLANAERYRKLRGLMLDSAYPEAKVYLWQFDSMKTEAEFDEAVDGVEFLERQGPPSSGPVARAPRWVRFADRMPSNDAHDMELLCCHAGGDAFGYNWYIDEDEFTQDDDFYWLDGVPPRPPKA